MAKYLFVYHGGGKPDTEEEGVKAKEQWAQWFGSMGDKVIDGGSPVGQSHTVTSDETVVGDGGSNPATGYGVFTAATLDEALAMARGCPLFSSGGSVEVAETFEP